MGKHDTSYRARFQARWSWVVWCPRPDSWTVQHDAGPPPFFPSPLGEGFGVRVMFSLSLSQRERASLLAPLS
jgi:hypothetical protein